MPQARDEAGNIWEVDAQGNPVRLVSQAAPAQPPADPTFQYQGQKAQAEAVRAQAEAQVATSTVDADIRLANAQAEKAQAETNRLLAESGSGNRLSPGQESADKTFAKDYAAWTAGGGMAGLENKLRVLEEALVTLEGSDTITGPVFGRLPKFIQQMINPASQDVRADVERAIQETLRQTLGAQFTQKEGEGILARTFDPTQGEVSNARRARNLITELRSSGTAKESASRYFENNGTISGWTAPRMGENAAAAGRPTDPRLPGFSPGAGPDMQAATGGTYSTPEDIAVTKAMQQVYNSGGSIQDLANVSRQFGRPVDLQQTQEWARAIDYRDAKGEYEGQRTGFSTINTPQSGQRSAVGQIYGDFARGDIGSSVVGAGVGAANAATFGGIDEIVGGINTLRGGGDLGDNIAYANLGKQAAFNAAPLSALGGEILAGGGLGGLAAKAFPKAAQILAGSGRRVAGTGAALGAGVGALESNDNRLGGAALGAALGAGGGVLGSKVAAPVIDAAMRTRPMQATSEAIRKGINYLKPGAVEASANVPQFALGERLLPDGDEIASAAARLQEAQRYGLPMSLADADPKLRMLAGSVSRKSPQARELAENTFGPRGDDQAERATTAISTYLSPPVDIAGRKQQWKEVGQQRAGPLYEEAYQGGSIAPLENQLNDALNTSSKSVAEARAALTEAQRMAALSGARVSRAGNDVYGNAQALPADRASQQAIEGAQQRLTQAEAQRDQVLEKLRQSQGDAASNAPGAVWNPRLQEFIDDPLSKTGLARGLEIQRLEALAEGRPFDPTEYAVIGTDQAGNPIVGNVPNLRTLDAIKKGYDSILDEYPRDMRGKQIFDQRGRAITMAKQSLVTELDGVTGGADGAYASARDAFGTYTRLGNNLDEGYAAAPRGTYARDLEPRLAGKTEPELDEFRSGYATRLGDMVSDAGDSSNPYRTIYGGNERRAKIATVFPEGSQDFGNIYNIEREMAKTQTETMGGSQTGSRLAADSQFDNGATDFALGAMGDMAGGGGALTARNVFQRATRALGDNWRVGASQGKADAMAPVLFNTNPNETLPYLTALRERQAADRARKQAFGRRTGLFGATVPLALLPSE